MLTNLLQLITRQAPAHYEQAFVHELDVKERIGRNPWAERLILAGWLAIVVKCFVVIWAIDHWAAPFSPYWIIVPTILMAGLCTAVYYWPD